MSDCRVLVVDDDKVFRTVIGAVVSSRGMQWFAADDGIDALIKIHDVKPQVIVADVAKPNLWGFELLPFIRHRFPGIGVIAIVRNTEREHFAQNPAADVVFLEEDWIAAELLSAIDSLYSRYPLRAAATEGGTSYSKATTLELKMS